MAIILYGNLVVHLQNYCYKTVIIPLERKDEGIKVFLLN